jgi:type VI secretion system secreted protein VgrG
LKERLSRGRISDGDRRAINKLLSAELVEMKYQSRLLIKGPAPFVEKTREHLVTLSRLPVGRKLFRSLSRSGRLVTIVPAVRGSEAPPEDFRAAIAKGKVLRWQDQWGRKKTIRGIGTGSDTTIKYNPDLVFSAAAEASQRYPAEIGLAHELIHARDAAYGQLDPGETEGLRNYERQAIGLPPYEQKEFTENRFRAQWHTRLPERTTY